MTAREMQIAFERRLQLIDPELANDSKVDSSTIFQLLNAYTVRFIQQNYLNEDNVDNTTRAQNFSKDAISVLLTDAALTNKITSGSDIYKCTFDLPANYFQYVRSTTNATTQWDNSNSRILTNELVSEEQINKVITNIHNSIILPHPYVSIKTNIHGRAIEVITDKYTSVSRLNLTYYRKPKPFNVIGVDNTNVLAKCELPDTLHDAIVDGAVEMFIAENKYRLTRKNNNE